MNSSTFDPSTFAAFSLLPIVFFLLWTAISFGLLIFAVVMVIRFVRAHEQIARQLQALGERVEALKAPGSKS
jgi:hypothetical protein